MKSRICYLLFFICLIIFGSCKKHSNNIPKKHLSNAKALKYFKLSQEKKSPTDRIKILTRASSAIVDPNDTLPSLIYDYQIYYYTQIEKYDSASFYIKLLRRNALLRKDTLAIAKSYYRQAKINLHRDNPAGVLKNMYKAKNFYQLAGDSTQAGRRLVELGNAQLRLGDYSGAQESGTEALKYLKEKDSTYLSSDYNLIALSYFNLGDYDEAIEEYQNAISLSRDKVDSIIIKNNIANIYLAKNNYQEAFEILEKLIQENNLELEEVLLIKDNYYFNRWKFQNYSAENELENILERRIEINDLEGLLSSYYHLTQYYKNKNPQKSLRYAKNYFNVAKKFNDVAAQLTALEYLMRLENPTASKNLGKEYIRLNDSVTKARNQIKNLFAKIKYDEEAKIRSINQLEKMSALQKLETVKQRNQKIIMMAGLFILFMISLFAFYYFKNKHRKEKLQKVYETETRISKKVHDELANDLYLVMTLLPKEFKNVLDKIDNIYRRTRDISKENTEINTGPEYEEELIEMINSTASEQTRLVVKRYESVQWSELKNEQKITVYRVIQELMVNMRKHSQANLLVLEFGHKKSRFFINYRDNGIGTNFKKEFSGLQNAENRIHSIKGNITFKSEPGKGFECQISFPR